MNELNSFTEEQILSWNEIEKSGKDLSTLPEKYKNMSTKSEQIRTMFKDGYTKGAIAKVLGIRYQHVRNVLTYKAKKAA